MEGDDHIFFRTSLGIIGGRLGKKMNILAGHCCRAMLQSEMLENFPPFFSLIGPGMHTFEHS